MANALQLLHDYVIVRMDERPVLLSNGQQIITPEWVEDQHPRVGTVVAVGPGRKRPDGKRLPMEIVGGERVIVSKWAGVETDMDDPQLMLVRADDILAYIGEFDD